MTEQFIPHEASSNNPKLLTDLKHYKDNLLVGAENAPKTRHLDGWPVVLHSPGTAVLGWYGEKNFLLPEADKPHEAIDIFCPEGTDVLAPAAGHVVYVDHATGWHNTQTETGHMVDLAFLTTTGIVYWLVHLDKDSLHSGVETMYGVNGKPVFIEAGKVISKIARWPENMEDLKKRGVWDRVPPAVREEYQTHNADFGPHLHVAANNVGQVEYKKGAPWVWSVNELRKKDQLFNPLLSFNYLVASG